MLQTRTSSSSCCSQNRSTTRQCTSIRQQQQQLHRSLGSAAADHHQSGRRSRCQAVPVADVADMSLAAEAIGGLGIAAGGLFGALFNLEKQNGAKLQQQVSEVQQQVQELQTQLALSQQQLQQEQQARKEAEEWRPRLDAAQTELFKLERALELKDGQLAVFMGTAHRQIKGLEETVKELQKM